jgi:hypothetical protein
MARRSRSAWITAIAVVTLSLFGACVVALYCGRGPSLETWAERLKPSEGHLLHAETQDGHHLIAYRVPGDVLRMVLVHPPHPMARSRYWAGTASLGPLGPTNYSITNSTQARDPMTPEVDRMNFAVPTGWSGELHFWSTETVNGYLGTYDVIGRQCVFRWP